jgi:nucleoside-diphosphate-sugar epimerase
MDLLLTGDLSNLVDEFCKQLSDGNRVVIASKYIEKKNYLKKPAIFPCAPNDPLFSKLFDSYSFNVVIFLARRGEQKEKETGMIEDLDHCLQLCVKHNVSQVIYVSSSEVYAGNDNIDERCSPIPIDNSGYILAAGENLIKFYRLKFGLNTIVIHIPYMYGDSISDSLLANIYAQHSHNEKYVFHGLPSQQCDFIKDTDLVSLIAKLIDEGYDLPHGVINLGSGSPISLYELAELVRKVIPNFEYEFTNTESSVPPHMKVETALNSYNWIPYNKIVNQMAVTLKKFTENNQIRISFLRRFYEKVRKNHFILTTIELIIGFALMQFLNFLSSTDVQYRYVDFRLLFVVFFGSVYGIRVGMLAVLLAIVSCVLSYYGTNLDWQLMFFNIDNWLPFLIYIAAGVVTGYIKDKSVSVLELEKEQRSTMEERYVFLYELYDQTLKNKRQYQDQLLSYRNSFGRIYNITKRLDNVLPDSVIHEAVVILEDLLQNQSISIYTVNQNATYARLWVSSKNIYSTVQKSIRLNSFRLMLNEIKRDEIWCNKELIDGYPAYCAPVFSHEKITALIMINEVRYEQMTTYYYNLIKVLCGLIKDSLIRALNYDNAIEDKIFIEGTRIYKCYQFENILAAKQKMRGDNVANYELLRINNRYKDITSLYKIIEKCIRSTDTIGQGRDGYIYIILTQIGQESINMVMDRFLENGISCTSVNGIAIPERQYQR